MDDTTRCIFRCGLRDLKLSEIKPSDEILNELVQLMTVKDLSILGTVSWKTALLNDESTTIFEDLETIRKIHIAGAITRSSLYQDLNDSDRMKVLETLLRTEENNYFGLVSYHYLSYLLPKIDFSEFKWFVVPFITSALSKPWQEQILASLYLLIVVEETFPESVTPESLENSLGTSEIFCLESVNHICNIVMSITEKVDLEHPIFKMIAEKLLASNLVEEFFNEIYIVNIFSDAQYRIVTFLLTEILKHIEVPEIISNILPKDYIKEFISMYEDATTGRDTKILIEKLYSTSISSLNKYCADSEVTVEILKKLLFIDGRFKTLKGTVTHDVVVEIINFLPMKGIEEIAKTLKDVILGTSDDSFREGQYASGLFLYLISQSYLHDNSEEWTIEQIAFLQTLCFLKDHLICESLANVLENFFYKQFVLLVKIQSDSKRDFPEILHEILKIIDEGHSQNLRWRLTPSEQQNWAEVLEMVRESEDSSCDTNFVFHTFSLWFAFRLLGRHKLHPSYFSELFSCYESIKVPTEYDEIVWTKIVGLILALLSRDSYSMKLIINEVIFPVVCEHMTSTVLYPILYLLDPTTIDIHFLNPRENSEQEQGEHIVGAPNSGEPDYPSILFKFLRTWQITETATIEYRIRILHLIKIYLNCKPSMLESLEILSQLLKLLWFCLKDKVQRNLSKEIKRCLQLFPKLRFSESRRVTERFLVNILQDWFFKKTKRRINKNMMATIVVCSICILKCSQLLEIDDEETSESRVEVTLTGLMGDALYDFLTEKCNIPYDILKVVFKFSWNRINTVALVPTMFVLLFTHIVPIKRLKGIELLKLFFRNRQYIESHLDEIKLIEEELGAFLQKWVGFFKKLNGKVIERVEEMRNIGEIVRIWPDLELEVWEYCTWTTNVALKKVSVMMTGNIEMNIDQKLPNS